jgi:hypothetical protein
LANGLIACFASVDIGKSSCLCGFNIASL